MSNLSDFFPAGEVVTFTPDTAEKNAYVLLVGGGGGGSTGNVRETVAAPLIGTYLDTGSAQTPSCSTFGGGGGGVYVGNFNLIPGVPYPVVVGAGGACGCMLVSCAGEPGGAGSNGGISRFGNCIVMGGGGAGTFCLLQGPAVTCCVSLKYVHNKDGANAGSTGRYQICRSVPPISTPTGLCATVPDSIPTLHMPQDTGGAVSSFRVDDTRSAGGGFFAQHIGSVQIPGSQSNPINSCQDQFNLAKGYFVECNPTNDSWELKSTFFGLKLIPDTESTSYPNYIMYCCTPTTVDVPSLPAPAQTDITANPACITCYAIGYGHVPAVFWKLGVSRNQEKNSTLPTCGVPCLCPTYAVGGISIGKLQPPVANTGSGGFNNACIIDPTYVEGFTGVPGCTVPSYYGWLQGPGFPFNSDLRIQGNGDAGVVYIVYDCNLGAASSTPGAVDCTPVTGPQGYRSYRYTSSGSFTL